LKSPFLPFVAPVLAFALAGCQCLATPEPVRAPAPAGRVLAPVEARVMRIGVLRLQSGVVLKDVEMAYETYGTLDAAGSNAVLISHGNTSTHHAAGRYAPGKAALGVPEAQPGWWDAIIGPGKAFDTDRLFVVSANLLGGSYGSTGPRSTNPATGRPFGPDFPDLTLVDMAAAQKALLEHLGVKRLKAVAGPSYGGFLSFQWAVGYPEMVDGAVVVVPSPTGGRNPQAIQRIVDTLAKDANWNSGHYYDRGGIVPTLTQLRIATLKAYGIERQLASQYPDDAAREEAIRKLAEPWARSFDGNSLVVQRKAMEFRDHVKDFNRVRAKVLYILADTDKLFPPSIAPGVMRDLRAAGVDATYLEIQSEKGHSAGSGDALKFEAALRTFLARL